MTHRGFNRSVVILFILVILGLLYVGCSGNDSGSVISAITGSNINTNSETPEMVFANVEAENKYYSDLEKVLNEKLNSPSDNPNRSTTIGLQSVTLNIVTDEIKTTATYNLSKIVVTAYVANEQPKVVTPVWTIYSALGTLNGTEYTSIAKAETAVFKATYTENGVSKLALFRLKVTGLNSIVLSRTTSEVQLPATFDLANEVVAYSNLSNGTTQEITLGLTWILTSGAGTLSGTVYTPPVKIETAVFTATYMDSGITKTAQFRLSVTGLSALSLSKATDSIQLPATYDLSTIIATAKMSTGQLKEISPTWSVVSGTGTLSGNIYTPAAKPETVVFSASYAEPGVSLVKTAQFRLTVIGLYSITLSQPTDEIQLPATYDLASELVVNAKYSNGVIQNITNTPNLWALKSGSGSLTGTLYTPAAKPETAVFIATYIDAGITKTAQLSLKVIGLSSLALNKTTDEIQSCVTYDLANLIVTDKLSNGQVRNISTDPNMKWVFSTGAGTLNGTVYKAPAKAETAVFIASYTEAGITKTIYFRLRVNALTSLVLGKVTDEVQISTSYDLSSNEVITAKFSNGTTKVVTADPNTKWTLAFGSGTLNGAIYTTPERIETATLTATYTEAGVAQSAQFRLKISAMAPGTKVMLVGLTIDKTTDAVQVGGTYDLGSLVVTGKYSDKTTKPVMPLWIITSGGGSVNGTIFTAPDNIATVRLMGSCTAEDGSVKSVYLTLMVYGTIIFGNQAIVTPAGATINSSFGVSLEILPDSVSSNTRVSISDESNKYNFEGISHKVLGINTDGQINGVIIRFLIEPGMNKSNYSVICIPPNSDELTYPDYSIEDTTCVIILDSQQNSNLAPKSILRAGSSNKGTLKKGLTNIDIQKIGEYTIKKCIAFSNANKIKKIPWPFYHQYYGYCMSAALLMLIKGCSNNVSPSEDESYKINKLFGVQQDGYKVNNNLTFLEQYSKSGIGTSKLTNYGISDHPCGSANILVGHVIDMLSQNKPIVVFGHNHAIVIVGYKVNADVTIDKFEDLIDTSETPKLKFIVHDPKDETYSYREMKLADIIVSLNYYKTIEETVDTALPGYATYTSSLPFSGQLQTIHLPENATSKTENLLIDGTKKCIAFINNSKPVAWTKWSLGSSEGYCWTNVPRYNWDKNPQQELSTIPEFDNISILDIPIHNTALKPKPDLSHDPSPKTITRLSIIEGNIEDDSKIIASESIDRLDNGSSSALYSVNSTLKSDAITITRGIVNTFKTYLSENKITNNSDYLLRVSIVKGITGAHEVQSDIIDKFVLKFKYIPALIHSIDGRNGDLQLGFQRSYICKLGNEDITKYVKWSYSLNGGAEQSLPSFDNKQLDFIQSQNKGKYTIFARTGADNPSYNNIEARIDVNVVDFKVVANKAKVAGKYVVEFGEKLNCVTSLNDIPVIAETWKLFKDLAEIVGNFFRYFFEAPSINGSPRALAPGVSGEEFTAPTESGLYEIKASYQDYQATCAVEVLPFDMTTEVALTMKPDEIIPVKVTIEGITSEKTITPYSYNGELTEVSKVFSPNEYKMVFMYNLKLKEAVKDVVRDVSVRFDIVNFAIPKMVISKIIVMPPLNVYLAPKHEFIGNEVQYAANFAGNTVTNQAVWKVENPDSNVITDGQGVFANGLLKTTGDLTSAKEYFINVTYFDNVSQTDIVVTGIKTKILPGIIPRERSFVSSEAQSFQLKFGTEIVGDPETHITWYGSGLASSHNPLYSFSAHQERRDEITLWLPKGTILSTGETIETDLHAHAHMNVFDIFIEPKTVKTIDIHETSQYVLSWSYNIGNYSSTYSNITTSAGWSGNAGAMPVAAGQATYTPTQPGVHVITAKIPKDTQLYYSNNKVIGNDIEITSEVRVVEIKVLEAGPLTAQLEPVDAAGNPISQYRLPREFTVSVDGGTVPIDLPYITDGQNKGTIEQIGMTDGSVVPVIYTFKYNPPPPMATSPYYFDGDETLHVNIKSPAFTNPSASTVITVYRPVLKHIAVNYASGRKYYDANKMVYNTGEHICFHGAGNFWRDDAMNSFWATGSYDRGECTGIHYHYIASGKLEAWYNFPSFVYSTCNSYSYIYSSGAQTTKTDYYSVTRTSIYEPWNWSLVSTTYTPGWTPPAESLP